MQDLRHAPGYADMEDYYDSALELSDLLSQYHALQVEQQQRSQLHFLAAEQCTAAASPAPPVDDTYMQDVDAPTPAHPIPRNALPLPPRQTSEPGSSGSPSAVSQNGSGRRRSSDHDESHSCRRGSHNTVRPNSSHAGTLRVANASGGAAGVTAAATMSGSSRPARAVSAGVRSLSPPSTESRSPHVRDASPGYLLTGEPHDYYDDAVEARRQEQFLSESKRLGKAFVPSNGSGLDGPTRFMLGDCVKQLYRTIAPAWRMANPLVVSTAEDLIAVYFSTEKIEKLQLTTLLRFMNASLLHNSAVREFRLTKVPEGWDVLTSEGYMLYTFRPPWVKKRMFLPDTIMAGRPNVASGAQ